MYSREPSAPAAGRGTSLLLAVPVAAATALLPVMAAAGLAQQVGAWTPVTAGTALLLGVALTVAVLPRLQLPRLPWRAAALLLGLCTAFGLWAALTSGEHLVVRRDPGAYATYALALARFGGVPLDPGLELFGLGATDPAVRVSAAANYQVFGPVDDGGALSLRVSPQFLVGVPALLSGGWWLAGWAGLLMAPAVAAGLALAAFAGLAAHLLGRRAALLAVVLLGLAQPVLLVARQTFSEPFSLLYLLSGAALLVLATERRTRASARWPALLAGALLGANLFVRIDAVRELVLLVPLVALLVGRRHPAGAPLAAGAVLSGVPAALATTWWDSAYVASVQSSLGPLLLVGALLAAVGVVGVVVGRQLERAWTPGGPPAPVRRLVDLLPGVAAALVAVAGVVLASRPAWLVDRRAPYIPGQDEFVGTLQSLQGLPVDGLRTYAEHSVTWLVWWVGPVTVVLALLAAVALTFTGVRAALSRGPLPGWLLPAAIGVVVTLVSLYRPAITSDHPWADRRYVTVTYPFVVLAATAAVTWLARRRPAAPAGGSRSAPGSAVGLPRAAAALLVLGMLLPTALATLPMATSRTEVGQLAATETVCDAIAGAGDDPAVLAVGFRSRVEWAPVVRARCGVPLVGIQPAVGPSAEEMLGDVLARAADGARASGRTPVVLVGDRASAQLVADATGLTLPQVVSLSTTEPERLLVRRPLTTRPLPVDAWVAELP